MKRFGLDPMAVELAYECFFSHYSNRRPVDWARCFSREAPLLLEIGSGHGDFLLRLARENPGTQCDRHRAGMGTGQDHLAQGRAGQGRAAAAVTNAKSPPDAGGCYRGLARLFQPESIAKAIAFSLARGPRKNISNIDFSLRNFCGLLNSRLVPGGEAWLVTDARPYFTWVLEQLPDTGFRFEKKVIQPRYDTKYERKWSAQGQKEFYELFLCKEQDIAVPRQEDAPLRVYLAKDFSLGEFSVGGSSWGSDDSFEGVSFDPQKQKAMVRLIVAEKT